MFNTILNRIISHSLTQTICSQLVRTQGLRRMEMHSNSVTHDYKAIKVKVLPALSDNYMYLLIDQETNEAAVVDPVDPETVIRTANEENVSLTTVLTTHHHWDHAGGNTELVDRMKNTDLIVVGGDDRVSSVSKVVNDGEELKVGSLSVKCLHTPCHTSGHICYYVTSPSGSNPLVFTGDTLFIAGCGRFFEGTAEQMNEALNKKLAELPDDTKVYCGHEYTTTNLKFAETVEPNNEDVKNKLKTVISLRNSKEPTVPSSVGDEKKINPFMRVNTKSVQTYAKSEDTLKTMSFVRKQKDSFKC